MMDIIPPAIRILLEEDVQPLNEGGSIPSSFKRLIPELRRQAEWTESNFAYPDSDTLRATGGFVVTASGGMDPISARGICTAPKCLRQATLDFARSTCLISDIVLVPDELTAILCTNRKLNSFKQRRLAEITDVIKTLEPLIRAGVVRFRSSKMAFCEKHLKEFDTQVKICAEEMISTIATELSYETATRRDTGEEFLVVNTGHLYDRADQYVSPLSPQDYRRLKSGTTIEELGRENFVGSIRNTIAQALIDMKCASRTSSVLLSSSQLELAAIKSMDQAAIPADEIATWERERSFELPFIRQLLPADILQLREIASKALPRFRELMLTTLESPEKERENAISAISALRSQAEELKAELGAIGNSRERRFRNLLGSFGITISVYGFASGFVQPGAALTGLLSLLGLLHANIHSTQKEIDKIESHPAYVLLKAKGLTKKGC
jgi:hypothetical protein